MGCHHGKNAIKEDIMGTITDDRSPTATPYWTQSLLTDQQKELIYGTWRNMSDDLVTNGMRVFQYIFMRRPDVKNLFSFRELDWEQLPNDTSFRMHASHFMQAIAAAVDNLDDLDTKLTPLLLALGEQHSQTTGFGVQYFELFTQCLILVWEERLGDKFTPEARAAWEKMFVFILMTLREGYTRRHGHEADPMVNGYNGRINEQTVK
ncbi:hypothetical protein LSH36_1337g00010 [Paralvinella palmiformis]|uniref:Globin domain-containing protein n=1 Tax=Paralvinella palmiformis TaxID=53620 RepID=A0AAD9ITV3_9ANNE|nr:hypothetical protein LSH36_1337g00010 [Paralvinella palmiformis]